MYTFGSRLVWSGPRKLFRPPCMSHGMAMVSQHSEAPAAAAGPRGCGKNLNIIDRQSEKKREKQPNHWVNSSSSSSILSGEGFVCPHFRIGEGLKRTPKVLSQFERLFAFGQVHICFINDQFDPEFALGEGKVVRVMLCWCCFRRNVAGPNWDQELAWFQKGVWEFYWKLIKF